MGAASSPLTGQSALRHFGVAIFLGAGSAGLVGP